MAFALSLFVQAANQTMVPPLEGPAPGDDEDGCAGLYDTLCLDRGDVPVMHARVETDHETSLYTAFRALCGFYVNDPLQAAICARVLAFYFLMEHSEGAAIDGWLQPSAGSPELVILHPAVVDAIATVTLHGGATLSADTFTQQIAALANAQPQTH